MSNLNKTLSNLTKLHKENGILLDTNVLLLYIFALFQPSKIGSKRLSKYVKADGEMIIKFVNRFNRVLTTPHILAETSNLARQISKDNHGDELAQKLYPLFCNSQQDKFLHLNINVTSIESNLFGKLGLTDSCIVKITQDNKLLLTDDLDLYVAAISNSRDVINFTHMREVAGII